MEDVANGGSTHRGFGAPFAYTNSKLCQVTGKTILELQAHVVDSGPRVPDPRGMSALADITRVVVNTPTATPPSATGALSHGLQRSEGPSSGQGSLVSDKTDTVVEPKGDIVSCLNLLRGATPGSVPNNHIVNACAFLRKFDNDNLNEGALNLVVWVWSFALTVLQLGVGGFALRVDSCRIA